MTNSCTRPAQGQARARRWLSCIEQAVGSVVLLCALALLLALPRSAKADDAPSLSTPSGMASLILPPDRRTSPHPVVLILSDRTGADGREAPYVDYLLGAGIAVVTLGVDEPERAAPLLTLPWLRAIALSIAPGRLDASRIGVLGFGGGGRAALAASAEVPVAALYPSCSGLPPSQSIAPMLLLHPDDPAEAAACRRVAPRPEAIWGATHGWDHGQGLWEGGTTMLPHPDGSRTRIFSRSDGWATQEAVARVLRHFETVFGEAASIGRDSGR